MASAQVRHQPLSKSHASPVLEAALRRPVPSSPPDGAPTIRRLRVLYTIRRLPRNCVPRPRAERVVGVPADDLLAELRPAPARGARGPRRRTAPGAVPRCLGEFWVWSFECLVAVPFVPFVASVPSPPPTKDTTSGPHVIGGLSPTPSRKMRIQCGILFPPFPGLNHPTQIRANP